MAGNLDMKRVFIIIAGMTAAAGLGLAEAADARNGAKLAEGCAACHGPAGVSVSADIPNLAAQKGDYVTAQLKAFREGRRSNPLMNAVAAGLSDDDIADLAAHFAALPGATPGTEGAAFVGLDGGKLRLPAGFARSYTMYDKIDFPDKKQVRHYWADPAAVQAARDGKPMPSGAMILVEVYDAKLGPDGQPVKGADGHFEAGELALYTAMQKLLRGGSGVPELFANGDWRYAVFEANGSRKATNEAKCMACHKPQAAKDYLFTAEPLAKAN